jgi:oligopeptide transport system ATP-binding protein
MASDLWSTGESGCGKSTLARVLIALEKPTGGSVRYRGRNLFELSAQELREVRRHIQIVLQDPDASLNPRMKIGEALSEPFEIHPGLCPSRQRRIAGARAVRDGRPPGRLRPALPAPVLGWSAPAHRERIAVARALAVQPAILVCDESVSSLDVSAQA